MKTTTQKIAEIIVNYVNDYYEYERITLNDIWVTYRGSYDIYNVYFKLYIGAAEIKALESIDPSPEIWPVNDEELKWMLKGIIYADEELVNDLYESIEESLD